MRAHPRPGDRPLGLLVMLVMTVVVGLIALGLSVVNAFALRGVSDAQLQDRITADVSSCERGNTLRTQTAGVGDATRDLITGILDAAPENGLDDAKLSPLFAEFDSRLGEIVVVDCEALTPGAGT